ncbi:MAG: 50S ribosomal protein L4 [Candidatus Doudnabacteria bacterium]|nr:50S ribosomal protein L4 [Candidatus Doudnabacteria bacterium]
MKLNLFDQKGKKSTKQVEVSDAVFGAKVNKRLLSQYVFVYLSNQREAVAHTKDRSEVSGGGKKPWNQKGTGRARAGSNRSPLWRKGGVTFGPSNERNWKKTMNKKMRKQAMCSALSMLVANDKLKVLETPKFSNEKLTKQAVEMWTSFGSPRKMTIVLAENQPEVLKAFGNLENAQVKLVSELSAYDVLNAGELLIASEALEYTNSWQLSKDETN